MFGMPSPTPTSTGHVHSHMTCNQPMRNLAIARGLEQEDTVEQAWFALCPHDANPEIAAHWANWKHLLPDPSMAPSLPASEVVAIGEADGLKGWAAYMRARYHL